MVDKNYMTVSPKSGNTILITGNINLIDSSGNLDNENITHVSKLISKGCVVLLMFHVQSDAEETKIRSLLKNALSTLPQKNLIFFECIQSIYSICRQIEPNYIIDAYNESYNLTAKFFSGRYFKTDATTFRRTVAI